MKIEYDVSLYKEMANFSINEVVKVTNRKGRTRTIHITNIAELEWSDLQSLVPEGTDAFTKRILLYRECSMNGELSQSKIKGNPLPQDAASEIKRYINIFRDYGCTKHHEVNQIITEKHEWDSFKVIRSLNDHGKYTEIQGIQPQYFEIICSILGISGECGLPLDRFHKY